MNGNVLAYDGSTQPTITLYYDTQDRGATSSGWAGTANLGTKATGAFTHNLTGLTAGEHYYFRYKAVNPGGTSYSSVGDFATIGTPVLSIPGASDINPTFVTLNAKIISTGGVTYLGGTPFGGETIPGTLMWMDGNDPNGDGTPETTTANVANWQDKSGDERDFDWKRGDPKFQANVLNGKGVVDFDGNDGLGQSNNAKSMYNHTANGFTMFAVSRYDGTDSERVISQYDNWNWLFAGHGQYQPYRPLQRLGLPRAEFGTGQQRLAHLRGLAR
jgi:hypothetical protein